MERMFRKSFSETEIAVCTGGPDVGEAFSRLAFDHLLFTGATSIAYHVMRAAAENLVPLSFILVGTLIGVYFSTMLNGWRLSKWLGAVFFGLYFVFVGYSLAHEFDLIDF
jgi:Ca2+/Na+ antiporter